MERTTAPMTNPAGLRNAPNLDSQSRRRKDGYCNVSSWLSLLIIPADRGKAEMLRTLFRRQRLASQASYSANGTRLPESRFGVSFRRSLKKKTRRKKTAPAYSIECTICSKVWWASSICRKARS
jgi:hypothetical protein